MPLLDMLRDITGITVLVERAGDLDAQLMTAALLLLVARSDGGVSPDESLRMVELLRRQYRLQPNVALDLINRAGDELGQHATLDALLGAARGVLEPRHKEDLMLMVLEIIAADDRKDAAEMRLLQALIDGLQISDKAMERAYARYFDAARN